MNLISCDQCGVVLDHDKLMFPPVYDHKEHRIIEKNCVWDDENEDYSAVIDCPACSGKIKELRCAYK